MTACIAKDILRLNVSVTDALGLNVSYRPHELVGVKLNNKVGHHLLHFQILLHHSVGCVWDVVHYDVQIHFVGLVSVRVKRLPHFYAVGVVQHLQDCELSIFVSLVLKHFLDGDCFSGLCNRRFKHDSE